MGKVQPYLGRQDHPPLFPMHYPFLWTYLSLCLPYLKMLSSVRPEPSYFVLNLGAR